METPQIATTKMIDQALMTLRQAGDTERMWIVLDIRIDRAMAGYWQQEVRQRYK